SHVAAPAKASTPARYTPVMPEVARIGAVMAKGMACNHGCRVRIAALRGKYEIAKAIIGNAHDGESHARTVMIWRGPLGRASSAPASGPVAATPAKTSAAIANRAAGSRGRSASNTAAQATKVTSSMSGPRCVAVHAL